MRRDGSTWIRSKSGGLLNLRGLRRYSFHHPLAGTPFAGRATVLQNYVANEFFYSESLAAGSLNQLPAPLGRNLADAWTNITAQNDRNKVLILLHDVYSYSQCDSQIHITTVVRPQFAGSGELFRSHPRGLYTQQPSLWY